MIKDTIRDLTAFDPEIGAAVEAEYNRQRRGIELIASENVVSEAVLLATGTVAPVLDETKRDAYSYEMLSRQLYRLTGE